MTSVLEDPDEFISIARYDWLVTRRWTVLHAVRDEEWTDAHRDDMARCWQVETPVRLACGQTAAMLIIPGMISRMTLPRCARCCRALGYPRGTGSPKNSDEIRAMLGLA